MFQLPPMETMICTGSETESPKYTGCKPVAKPGALCVCQRPVRDRQDTIIAPRQIPVVMSYILSRATSMSCHAPSVVSLCMHCTRTQYPRLEQTFTSTSEPCREERPGCAAAQRAMGGGRATPAMVCMLTAVHACNWYLACACSAVMRRLTMCLEVSSAKCARVIVAVESAAVTRLYRYQCFGAGWAGASQVDA